MEEFKNLFILYESLYCVIYDLFDCECIGEKGYIGELFVDFIIIVYLICF